MKSAWAVACLILFSGAFSVYGSGCAAAKSSISEFNRMDVGGGPGATLIQLTELQKKNVGKDKKIDSNRTAVASTAVSDANPVPAVPYAPAQDVPKPQTPAPAKSTPNPAGDPEPAATKTTVRTPPDPPAAKSKPAKILFSNRAGPSSSDTPKTASLASDVPATNLPPPSPPVYEPPPSQYEPSPGIAGAFQEDYSGGPRYRIGPEDLIRVAVWENKELSVDVVVRPDGKISVPLIRDVQAEGLTAGELAAVIEQKFLAYIMGPSVSVMVLEVNASKFYVLGYVKTPGTFPLRGDISVLQALSLAGGFTDFASPRRIRLVRKSGNHQEVRVINYYDMIDEGEGNYMLRPGDTIVVP